MRLGLELPSRRIALGLALTVVLAPRPTQARQAEIGAPQIQRLVAAEAAFFDRWRRAWEASEALRHKLPIPGVLEQAPTVHCHGGVWDDRTAAYVQSKFSAFAVCAGWFGRGLEVPIGDERVAIDGALAPSLRGPIRAARDTLIRMLEDVSGALPENSFLIGQRVRLLVDQGRVTEAMAAARSCRAATWWCSALSGYALAALHRWAEADSAYLSSMSGKPADGACRWDDVVVLLDDAARVRHDGKPCTSRDSLTRRVWWLADLLFSQPGNEGRVEQFVRATQLALRSALPRDERYDWSARVGSDARRELFLRYGWPTYAYWGGPNVDTDHTGWLASPTQRASGPNDPYTTYEYAAPRVGRIPRQRLIDEPFSSGVPDWATRALPFKLGTLWPREHFASPLRVVELSSSQTAFLRRDSTVLFAVAVDLVAAVLGRAPTETVDSIVLLTTTGPDSTNLHVLAAGIVGAPVVLATEIRSRPALAAIELPARGEGRDAARLRFGIAPPPPLSEMASGTLAVSDPVLLHVPPGGESAPPETAAALRRMAGSLTVQPVRQLGIYWEAYGASSSDSVEISVTVTSRTEGGLLRRLLGRGGSSISVGWFEPQPQRTTHTLLTRVPSVARTVILDVAQLAIGQYSLEVSMRKPRGPWARGARSFVVQ